MDCRFSWHVKPDGRISLSIQWNEECTSVVSCLLTDGWESKIFLQDIIFFLGDISIPLITFLSFHHSLHFLYLIYSASLVFWLFNMTNTFSFLPFCAPYSLLLFYDHRCSQYRKNRQCVMDMAWQHMQEKGLVKFSIPVWNEKHKIRSWNEQIFWRQRFGWFLLLFWELEELDDLDRTFFLVILPDFFSFWWFS